MKSKRAKPTGSSPRQPRRPGGPIRPAAGLPVVHPHAGGMDVGSVKHLVCVPEDAVAEGPSNGRWFGAFSGALDQWVEWVQACEVRTIALESTGVYWIALAQKLETAGIEVVLVNARHLKCVPGRKTEVEDCQWIQELQRICGVDLTQIIGLNVLSVLIILSEIGVDMSRWRSAKAFCAWLGLCPGNKISGGKVLDSRTAHVVNRVAILLRTLAPSIGKTETWLGVFHRRMRSRLGPAGANTATARKLACLIYHLLRGCASGTSRPDVIRCARARTSGAW